MRNRIIAICLTVMMFMGLVSWDAVGVFAADYEYAWFPAPVMNLTQLAYESYSHGQQNAIDISPGGTVFAPFTGKIVYMDSSWGYVVLQSTNKVYWADGTVEYMTVGFMHDENISDLYVGKTISQGQNFYHAGGMGDGDPNAYGDHVHITVHYGKVTRGYPYGNGDRYAFNAFYVNSSKTYGMSGRGEGYKVSGNTMLNGAPSDYRGLWVNLADAGKSYENLGDEFFAEIRHKASGYGIANVNGNVELGDEDASRWQFIRNSDNSYQIFSTLDGNAMDVAENKTDNYTNIQTYAPNTSTAQKWYIKAVGGGYSLISASSRKALDITHASTEYGANAWLFTANSTPAQALEIIRDCEVTYDTDGTITSEWVSEGLSIKLPYKEPDHFCPAVFAYWRTSDGTKYYVGDTVTVTEDITFYAVYYGTRVLTLEKSFSATAHVQYPGTGYYYCFKPDASRTYSFREDTADMDTVAKLYDADGNLLAMDDDSAGNDQFYLKYDLIEGKEYYFYVCPSDRSSAGSVKFTVSEQKNTNTIYVNASGTGWSNVNVYTWKDGDVPCTGDWPGSAMTRVVGDIYTYEVPADAQYIIFNNGVYQTADLVIPTDGRNLYEVESNQWKAYDPSQVTMPIYVNTSGMGWLNVNVYTWKDGEVPCTGDWPGSAMIWEEGDIYTYEIPITAQYIIFNDGSKQTIDLAIPTDGQNMYVLRNDKWETYVTGCNHSYNEGEIFVAPTCVSEGMKIYSCLNCGNSYTTRLEYTDHSYAYWFGVAPTVSATGTLVGTCKRCDATGTVMIPKLNSTDYVYLHKEATCVADGEDTYVLQDQTYGNFGYVVTVPATGHSYEAVITTAPGCNSAGVKTFTCENCGDVYTEVLVATGHNYEATITAPTCTENGYTTYTCPCGHSYVADQVTALGHSYKTVTVDATCTKDGSITDTCATCGDVQTKVIPATGHSFANGTCGACGEVDPDYVKPVVIPTLTLKAPTLEFKDMIKVIAFYTAENLDDVVEMGMLTYTKKVDVVDVNTAAYVIPGADFEESSGRYFSSSQGIHAKFLGDTVYLACYAKLSDGTYVYTKLAPYSPITYAANQLKKSTNMNLKQLCAAMLNYGAAAQNYFVYNTDVLANSTLTAEQIALPESYREDMTVSVPAAPADKQGGFTNNQGFSSRRPAVSFEGAFSINYFFTPKYAPVNGITLYYWTAADFSAASVLTTANATGSVAMVGSGTGQYRGDIEGIAAKDLSNAVYVAAIYSDGTTTWTSGVLGYSIGAYCSGQATKGGTMADLAMATAVYGYHAKQYFG